MIGILLIIYKKRCIEGVGECILSAYVLSCIQGVWNCILMACAYGLQLSYQVVLALQER